MPWAATALAEQSCVQTDLMAALFSHQPGVLQQVLTRHMSCPITFTCPFRSSEGWHALLQVDRVSGTVTVSNEGQTCASFHVCAGPQGGAEHAPIPEWLDVHPTTGELRPQVSTPSALLRWGQPMFKRSILLGLKGARARMTLAQHWRLFLSAAQWQLRV